MFQLVESIAAALIHFLNAHQTEAGIGVGLLVGVCVFFCADMPSESPSGGEPPAVAWRERWPV
jgi:hypothetical protein